MPKPGTLRSYSNRRRWTEADARAALAALEASGLSVGAFAKSEGLDAQRLYLWRRRLRTIDEQTLERSPGFVEITRSSQPVEVVLRSGRVLRVPECIDGESLRRLVDALDGSPC